MHSKLVLPISALAAMASAASHTVMVGEGGLKFVPAELTAASGDTIDFVWSDGPHSVVQGSFSSPCKPSSDAAPYSGVIGDAGQRWTLTLNSSDPLYFYCSVGRHCELGMVGAINAPSGMSESDYASAASSASGSSAPAQAQGGILNAPAASSSSMASTSSAASSSMASTMAMTSSMMMTTSSAMSSMSSGMSSSGSDSTASSSATGAGMSASMSPSMSASASVSPSNAASGTYQANILSALSAALLMFFA